jgi:hypothetical protein
MAWGIHDTVEHQGVSSPRMKPTQAEATHFVSSVLPR